MCLRKKDSALQRTPRFEVRLGRLAHRGEKILLASRYLSKSKLIY
jgi:hypothetical protein